MDAGQKADEKMAKRTMAQRQSDYKNRVALYEAYQRSLKGERLIPAEPTMTQAESDDMYQQAYDERVARGDARDENGFFID